VALVVVHKSEREAWSTSGKTLSHDATGNQTLSCLLVRAAALSVLDQASWHHSPSQNVHFGCWRDSFAIVKSYLPFLQRIKQALNICHVQLVYGPLLSHCLGTRKFPLVFSGRQLGPWFAGSPDHHSWCQRAACYTPIVDMPFRITNRRFLLVIVFRSWDLVCINLSFASREFVCARSTALAKWPRYALLSKFFGMDTTLSESRVL